MRFTLVFDRILPLWPAAIPIADGYLTSTASGFEPTPSNAPAGGSGFYFPTLSSAHSQIEDLIDHANDTWGSMMVWTMFQVFHSEAVALRSSGESFLHPASIPRSRVEARYFANLHSEGWEVDLEQYERS